MKKIFVMLMLFIVIFSSVPTVAFANTDYIHTHHYYAPWRDEYRVDHTGLPAYSFAWFRTHFTGSDGTVYTLDFDYYTGIMWLTCNGVYKFQFIDTDGSVMAESDEMITTSIVNPSCNSYPEQMGQNQLNADYTDLGGGMYSLDWNHHPQAEYYEVWKDGQKVGETAGNNHNLNGSGSVTIVAKDGAGNTVAESDLQVPTFDGGGDWGNGGGGGNGGCDACQKIRDALACPEWSTYMSEWEQTIRNALPPPPDWHYVSGVFADTFVNAFDAYLGDMPEPPGRSELLNDVDPNLPDVDASYPEAEDLDISVPAQWNEPLDFDITTGEQIQIIDNSEPFIITDPDIEHDEKGVFVFPNDERNDSRGIKEPESPELYPSIPQPRGGGFNPVDIPKPTKPMIIQP